jgi:hypothetical protein
METKDPLKEYRDNLERELNIADGMVRIGTVMGERSGLISASDDSDDAPFVAIALAESKSGVRTEVTATPLETMDAARMLVGAAMDADDDNWDGLWHDFKMSIQERRERTPKKSAA